MDFEQIGLRIKNCRKKKHLTQEEFAELVDVSPHYIYEIERGVKGMSLYTLDSVANHLEVSTDYILYGATDYHTNTKEKPDELSLLVETIPYKKRDTVAKIVSSFLPYI